MKRYPVRFPHHVSDTFADVYPAGRGRSRMVQTFDLSRPAAKRSIVGWTRLALRLVVAALVAGPAASKFLTHARSVEFFAGLGIPFPTAMVLLAGVVEVAAVALLVLGVGDDLAALALVPVMVVAILYVGVDWKNLAVLGGSLVLLVLRRERLLGRSRSLLAAVRWS